MSMLTRTKIRRQVQRMLKKQKKAPVTLTQTLTMEQITWLKSKANEIGVFAKLLERHDQGLVREIGEHLSEYQSALRNITCLLGKGRISRSVYEWRKNGMSRGKLA